MSQTLFNKILWKKTTSQLHQQACLLLNFLRYIPYFLFEGWVMDAQYIVRKMWKKNRQMKQNIFASLLIIRWTANSLILQRRGHFVKFWLVTIWKYKLNNRIHTWWSFQFISINKSNYRIGGDCDVEFYFLEQLSRKKMRGAKLKTLAVTESCYFALRNHVLC